MKNYKVWGKENIEAKALEQMENACSLPIAVGGAIMPDGHVGYGLPIGGILATSPDTVIPYGVGMDISCGMRLSILDIPVSYFQNAQEVFRHCIEKNTSFGVGAEFKTPKNHPVMDKDWGISPVTKEHKDKAWRQLGTSGSGNHFVEFGIIHVDDSWSLANTGDYVALLSHSGSRGTGGSICQYYSKKAKELHPELEGEMGNLAWLDLNTDIGKEYWNAMNLMGEYAAANHELIHKSIASHLDVTTLASVENHHNLAWQEEHNGTLMNIHRKGATPAGEGVIGIIAGTMATPSYVVSGKGNIESYKSASHGAGRAMSRTATKKMFTWEDGNKYLKDNGVTLMSAGLDEIPNGYKDIESVMKAQEDLVEVIGKFEPKLVKMAPGHEKAED